MSFEDTLRERQETFRRVLDPTTGFIWHAEEPDTYLYKDGKIGIGDSKGCIVADQGSYVQLGYHQ